MTLKELQEPVLLPFTEFRDTYLQYAKGSVPLLDQVETYIAQKPGKQLRPLLLLLSARACNTLTPSHVQLAAAMELLHNATLMHDDVVDESDTRRGQDSVRHHWSNQVAVLCGDYYLAQVMLILQKVGRPEVTSRVTQTVATMCQGELKQLGLVSQENISTDNYLNVIGSKTASLMALCCELGAMNLADDYSDNSMCGTMHDFGYNYGITFQIRDDVLDSLSPHDISFPTAFNPQDMIEKYTERANRALLNLSPSRAKEALSKLLLPSAPHPTNT